MLVCIGHRPIIFKGLGIRTGETHTKEAGLGVMFHLVLPARSAKKKKPNILRALQHTYSTLDLKYRYPGGGAIEAKLQNSR